MKGSNRSASQRLPQMATGRIVSAIRNAFRLARESTAILNFSTRSQHFARNTAIATLTLSASMFLILAIIATNGTAIARSNNPQATIVEDTSIFARRAAKTDRESPWRGGGRCAPPPPPTHLCPRKNWWAAGGGGGPPKPRKGCH